jgi:eukaryotic-like serine/threonine-protein kinase
MTPASQPDLAASLAGRYTIERELGRGGMATVFLVADLKHGRPMALKVLHPELGSTLGPERFRREIMVVAKLQHPHILTVHDSGETATGQLWFTMPYVDGESLRARIRHEGQLPASEAIRIAREAALALQYAHEHGVVHRDIKPENILLDRDGNTLIADFGVARALDGDAGVAADSGPTLTATGVAIGTPAYMSPEQASGERAVDARTDVYALGTVLYEMLAGEPPFTGASAQAIVAKRFAIAAPPVSILRDGLAPGVVAAVATALARSPVDRWGSAAAFSAALEQATQPGRAIGPASRRVPAWAAAIGVVVLAGAMAFAAWRTRQGSGVLAGPVGLAVLPFDNEGDSTNRYFADGITDEIRGKLSAIPALRLIASASANQYRHTTKGQEQIGRELGVRYLLTGRIQWEQSANGTRRVRVSPELVEVREGAAAETRWQQSYDTTLADVFEVQSAVATRVADKMGVVLSQPVQVQLAARPTQNLAAYDTYLRSNALVGVDPATVRRSMALAEQAVALDSGFAAAWARISRSHILIYANSVPTRADADAARHAADRAIALAPASAEGYLVRGDYYSNVRIDLNAARADYETALRLAPSSSGATGGLANVEASAGDWTAALGHAREAESLNPRSVAPVRRVAGFLLAMRRYPEARAEVEHGLTLGPADLPLIQQQAMSWLGEGDLAGARRTLRAVPPTLDRAALVSYLATSGELYWALDSADRALVLTLRPDAFDDDTATWGKVRADIYWLSGDSAHAHVYTDSARAAYEHQLLATPEDYERHELHGLALAYLGQRAAAEEEGARGFALAKATHDQLLNIPYARHALARLYVAAGDQSRAIGQLDSLLAKPYVVSPAWLRIDPTWASLRRDSRFERLAGQKP